MQTTRLQSHLCCLLGLWPWSFFLISKVRGPLIGVVRYFVFTEFSDLIFSGTSCTGQQINSGQFIKNLPQRLAPFLSAQWLPALPSPSCSRFRRHTRNRALFLEPRTFCAFFLPNFPVWAAIPFPTQRLTPLCSVFVTLRLCLTYPECSFEVWLNPVLRTCTAYTLIILICVMVIKELKTLHARPRDVK